jgi:hypothetical protein
MNDLYETDFVLWSVRQAELLRRMANGERVNDQLDWPNIVEEIESLGRNDRRDLRNRIQTALEHLMRLAASPATEPRHGWRRTLIEQRDAIHVLLEESPSLCPEVASIISRTLPKARELALLSLEQHAETPRVPLDQLVYTEEQVLGRWFPGHAPS